MTTSASAADLTVALDALLALFWRQGYNGATQEAMLAATGLSSSSLYRAFGTKPEIFAAALQRYLDLADDVLGPLEAGSQGRADLEVVPRPGGRSLPGGRLTGRLCGGDDAVRSRERRSADQ